MRDITDFKNLYLYNGIVDFRKSINGLSQIVKYHLLLNPIEDGLFIFVARNRCAIKFLYFDQSGFALWYKRLENERFKLPKPDQKTHNLTRNELAMLLLGYDVFKMKPHEVLSNRMQEI